MEDDEEGDPTLFPSSVRKKHPTVSYQPRKQQKKLVTRGAPAATGPSKWVSQGGGLANRPVPGHPHSFVTSGGGRGLSIRTPAGKAPAAAAAYYQGIPQGPMPPPHIQPSSQAFLSPTFQSSGSALAAAGNFFMEAPLNSSVDVGFFAASPQRFVSGRQQLQQQQQSDPAQEPHGERSVSGLMALSVSQQLPNGLTPPKPEPLTAPALQARLETIQAMLRTIKQAEVRAGLIPGSTPQPRRATGDNIVGLASAQGGKGSFGLGGSNGLAAQLVARPTLHDPPEGADFVILAQAAARKSVRGGVLPGCGSPTLSPLTTTASTR